MHLNYYNNIIIIFSHYGVSESINRYKLLGCSVSLIKGCMHADTEYSTLQYQVNPLGGRENCAGTSRNPGSGWRWVTAGDAELSERRRSDRTANCCKPDEPSQVQVQPISSLTFTWAGTFCLIQHGSKKLNTLVASTAAAAALSDTRVSAPSTCQEGLCSSWLTLN